MTDVVRKFKRGILLKSESSDLSETTVGLLWYNSTANVFKGYINGSVREIVDSSSTQTLTNKTLTSPTITGAALTGATISLDDSDSSFTLAIGSTSTLTQNRALTLDVEDGARTLTLAGNLTLSGDLITVGNDSITLTSSGTTDVLLPVEGTLSTLAGTEELTNKTLTSPKLNENVAVTTTATKLNYLTSATGTTGTASTNIVFSTSPVLTTPNLGTPSTLVGTNITGTASGLTAGTVTTNANLTGHITSTGNAAVLGSFTSLELKTALSDETGSGAAVFGTAPVLSEPQIAIYSSGGYLEVEDAQFTLSKDNTGSITAGFSANDLSENRLFTFPDVNGTLTALGNTSTGSGDVVLATSPTLITPALGTPSALVGTNITGTAAGLTAGAVTTNANLTGPITSVGNTTSVAAQTGTGSTFVMNTSPTLVTPILGVAAATSINKVAITAPATGATLTLSDGSTLAINGGDSVTLGSTGTTNLTLPESGTLATLSGAETFANKTLTSPKLNEDVAVTTTATKLNYITSATGTTGTASTNIVFSTSPTLTTPVLGVATATSINKVALTAPASSATLTIADGKTLTASNTLTFTGTDASSVAFGTGGTAQMKDVLSAKGDIYVATASATIARQGIGSDRQVLVADSTATNGLKWDNAPAGGINYFSSNPDFETNTTGYTTYADAAGTAPVDGV